MYRSRSLILKCISQDLLKHAAVTKSPKLAIACNSNSSLLHSFCILSLISHGSRPCCLHSRPKLITYQREKVYSMCGKNQQGEEL